MRCSPHRTRTRPMCTSVRHVPSPSGGCSTEALMSRRSRGGAGRLPASRARVVGVEAVPRSGARRAPAACRTPLVAARQPFERQPSPDRSLCRVRAALRPGRSPAAYHYAADRHVLERRCAFDAERWQSACNGRTDVVLVALTSIHWRESWKDGERAFRYCQHDLGHAVASLIVSAAIFGWRSRLLPAWSHQAIARLTGVDRDEDYLDAEREEPGCLLAIGRDDPPRADRGGRCGSRRCGGARRLVRTREPVERRSRSVDVHRRNRARN